MSKPIFSIVLAFFFVGGCLAAASSIGANQQQLPRVPEGFAIEVLVADVPFARAMTWGERGTLFIGSLRGDVVYAVSDALAAPQVRVLADGLKMPNGVAFRDGDLFVAESQRILRFADAESVSGKMAVPQVVVADLPYKSAQHAWKYLAFGPDGRLYVPVGAPCNVCEEADFARILSMRADGSDRKVVARGVRNSVGFDWHPETGEFWFTDNGRDMLGDEVPPCELNRVASAGQDFGFPYCHGGDIVDPEFGSAGRCDDAVAPVQRLAPHSAPLGMRFYTGNMFPADYRGDIFIAEHGSWNRSKAAGKTGYRVTRIRLDGNRAVSYEPFMEGFLDGDEVLGRPVDILLAPDGSMLVSDDKRGVVYRISFPASAEKAGR